MAYQAKKRKTFAEDLELVDEHGSVVHTLHVILNADDMVAKLNRKYTELTKSLAEVSEIQRNAENNEKMNEAFEKLGSAVTNLFEAVFGKEDTELIISYYERRYIEMTKEITPFITQCVIPRCIEIKKENQKNILSSYNRRQRRTLFRR